jgi:hypothetical protein
MMQMSRRPPTPIVTEPDALKLYQVLLPFAPVVGDPVVLETDAFGRPAPDTMLQVFVAVLMMVAAEFCEIVAVPFNVTPAPDTVTVPAPRFKRLMTVPVA